MQCDAIDCGSTFDSNEKLMEHERNQHVKSDQTFSAKEKTPTASPSRKKTVISNDATDDVKDNAATNKDVNETADVEMTEPFEENIKYQLELRIQQLEQRIQEEEKRKGTDEERNRKA